MTEAPRAPEPEPIAFIETADGPRVTISPGPAAIRGWVLLGVESAESFAWASSPGADGHCYSLVLQRLRDGWQVSDFQTHPNAEAAERHARELWSSDNA